MKRICVFCGASPGRREEYATAARNLGRQLASRKIGLVYGGGRAGLMGIIADAALSNGGEVIGVIPTPLATKELAHAGLTELRVVSTMHERKAAMADLADAFIALPGGFGTLEEFCEILTWSQLGLHPKACALFNVCNYFDPLLALFDHAVTEGFVAAKHRDLVISGETPEAILDAIARFKAPPVFRWIGEAQS